MRIGLAQKGRSDDKKKEGAREPMTDASRLVVGGGRVARLTLDAVIYI